MKLPRFEPKPGPSTLNGPLTEGIAAFARVFVGTGVVMGADVMIISPDPDVAAAVAEYLGVDPDRPALTHVIVGQPPWYQNQTRDSTLQDALEGPPPVKVARRAKSPRQGLIFGEDD